MRHLKIYTYTDCRIGIVHQQVEPSILLLFDLGEQSLDIGILVVVALYWDTLAAPTLYLP